GYEVLAPVYLRMGRFADAVSARRKLLTLGGETAGRQSDLGEALVAAANGVVTAEAKSAFERATALEPEELKARFYIGLAAEQDGDRTKAAEIWRTMMKNAPADAPWVPMVQEALARVDAQSPSNIAPGPTADDIAAAGAMSEKDRGDMIRNMVVRLADRLKENGNDVEGWQRLLRAYLVLGEREKAISAADAAKRALANDADKLRRIEDTIKRLGLEGCDGMTRKQRRLALIDTSLAVLAIAAALVLSALRDSIVFFNSPTDVAEKHLAPGTRMRIGGLIKPGSLQRGDNLQIRFAVTDGKSDITVHDQGIVPDMFREGQGVVTEGKLEPGGAFAADTVLAKHDERYMPREVVDALKKSGRWQEGEMK